MSHRGARARSRRPDVFAGIVAEAAPSFAQGNDPGAGRLENDRVDRPTQVPVALLRRSAASSIRRRVGDDPRTRRGKLTREHRGHRVLEPRWGAAWKRSCGSLWHAPTSRPHRAQTAPTRSRMPTTRLPTPSSRSGIRHIASRAYSYVAVAQFEALKAAWHFKYLYGRPSPSQLTAASRPWPHERPPGLVRRRCRLSGVSAELRETPVPTSVELITLKAGEQRQAALLSGKASASDIAAGLALGQAVAATFVARAGGDGMRTAGGSPAIWQAMADAATARGETPWRSVENPPRPPMLPFFGNVRAWMRLGVS